MALVVNNSPESAEVEAYANDGGVVRYSFSAVLALDMKDSLGSSALDLVAEEGPG